MPSLQGIFILKIDFLKKILKDVNVTCHYNLC